MIDYIGVKFLPPPKNKTGLRRARPAIKNEPSQAQTGLRRARPAIKNEPSQAQTGLRRARPAIKNELSPKTLTGVIIYTNNVGAFDNTISIGLNATLSLAIPLKVKNHLFQKIQANLALGCQLESDSTFFISTQASLAPDVVFLDWQGNTNIDLQTHFADIFHIGESYTQIGFDLNATQFSDITLIDSKTHLSIDASSHLLFGEPLGINTNVFINQKAAMTKGIPLFLEAEIKTTAEALMILKNTGTRLNSIDNQVQSQVTAQLEQAVPIPNITLENKVQLEVGPLLMADPIGTVEMKFFIKTDPTNLSSKTAVPLGVPNKLSEMTLKWGKLTTKFTELCIQRAKTHSLAYSSLISYSIGQKISKSLTLPWYFYQQQQIAFMLPFNQSQTLFHHLTLPWDFLSTKNINTSLAWQQFKLDKEQTLSVCWNPILKKDKMVAISFSKPYLKQADYIIFWNDLKTKKHKIWAIPWGPYIKTLNPQWEVPSDEQPPIKDDPNAPPTKRVYLMSNSINIVRLPERTPIHAISIKIDNNIDSWAWQFNINLASQADYELLLPTQGLKEIEININEHQWVAVVEKPQTQKRFADTNFSVWGRSRSAYLSTPYRTIRDYEQPVVRNLQQLASEELEFSNWTLVWNTVDYVVPGGVFSYQAKSPLEVVIYIANVIAATVQTHPNKSQLIVAPRHPISSWNWPVSSPDAVLPYAMIYGENIKWVETATVNKIYCIGGRDGGVIVGVKRAGTAGEIFTSQFVHNLVTDVEGGREKGRNVFSQSGKKKIITIETSLMPGLLIPKMLLEIETVGGNSWVGQVISCSVYADGLSVIQKIEVERYV
jgi:hypothetical protein